MQSYLPFSPLPLSPISARSPRHLTKMWGKNSARLRREKVITSLAVWTDWLVPWGRSQRMNEGVLFLASNAGMILICLLIRLGTLHAALLDLFAFVTIMKANRSRAFGAQKVITTFYFNRWTIATGSGKRKARDTSTYLFSDWDGHMNINWFFS